MSVFFGEFQSGLQILTADERFVSCGMASCNTFNLWRLLVISLPIFFGGFFNILTLLSTTFVFLAVVIHIPVLLYSKHFKLFYWLCLMLVQWLWSIFLPFSASGLPFSQRHLCGLHIGHHKWNPALTKTQTKGSMLGSTLFNRTRCQYHDMKAVILLYNLSQISPVYSKNTSCGQCKNQLMLLWQSLLINLNTISSLNIKFYL